MREDLQWSSYEILAYILVGALLLAYDIMPWNELVTAELLMICHRWWRTNNFNVLEFDSLQKAGEVG
jgi:hypothetical protein